MKQFEDANKEYTRAIEISKANKKPNGIYYYNRATIKGKLEWYEEAIKDYNYAIDSEIQGNLK